MVQIIVLILGALHHQAFGQASFPIQAGPFIQFVPPAISSTGNTVVFGSTVLTDGKIQDHIDVFAGAKNFAANTSEVGITADGASAVFVDVSGGSDGVSIVDTASGAMRKVASDAKGCVRPLIFCLGCIYSCLTTPHVTADGKKLLYAARRNQPFYVVNTDGSGSVQLPVYTGSLASASRRVIGSNGLVVFTSTAPFGPTFAAAATDVYVMNMDGTNIRNLTNYGLDTSLLAANATISGDGGTVVFELHRAFKWFDAPDEIWSVRTDGTAMRQISTLAINAESPAISADGKVVVFTQAGSIIVADPQGTVRNKITPFRFGTAQAPALSDDGLQIAFLAASPGGNAGAVYQVKVDGTGLRAIHAPRAISPRGVVSATGFGDSPSPGGIFSIYGINFTEDASGAAAAFPLPAMLAGISVHVNGNTIPLLSVSPWQINAQLPQETTPLATQFDIGFAAGNETPAESQAVSAAAPGLFTMPSISMNQAAAFHAGTSALADDARPAQAGEVLEMYGTGFGATNPAVQAGRPSPASPPAFVIATPGVTIGGIAARVIFAGLAPGFAGLYQLNVEVPQGLKPGRNSILLGRNGNGAITVH